MTTEQLMHSWMSGGGGETFVTLSPGAYELRSNYSSADGLRVLSGGLHLVDGPGHFSVAVESPIIIIQFGSLPRVIELWRQVASGEPTAPSTIDPAMIAPTPKAPTSGPETAP